jgi:hypothetical protein
MIRSGENIMGIKNSETLLEWKLLFWNIKDKDGKDDSKKS